MVRICSNCNVSMGIDASLSLEKYCFSLFFFPFAFLKALDLRKTHGCQLIQAGSEGKWQVGDGSRFETTPCSQPSTAHGVMLVCYRSVR